MLPPLPVGTPYSEQAGVSTFTPLASPGQAQTGHRCSFNEERKMKEISKAPPAAHDNIESFKSGEKMEPQRYVFKSL